VVRGLLDRRDDGLPAEHPRLGGRVGTGEEAGAEERAAPGAEVLRGEAVAHVALDVLVDVAALQVDPLAGRVDEVEDLGPGLGEEGAENARDLRVAKRPLLALAALPREVTQDGTRLPTRPLPRLGPSIPFSAA
jgi:hypothetical protein